MAVFTIAGLTLKEALRKRTWFGAILMGLLILGLSLLLLPIHREILRQVADSEPNTARLATEYSIARSHVMALCFFSIRVLGSLFAILLAGGAISGDLERGLLTLLLPRPIARWQFYVGKWLGLQTILVGSVLVWTALVWISLTLQTRQNLAPILLAGLYFALFPVVIGTFALTLSACMPRLAGTMLALVLCAFSWMDGIFNALGNYWETDLLHQVANVASVVVPQGCIALWIKAATRGITASDPRLPAIGESPQLIQEWGERHLAHFAHLDAVYLIAYIAALFMIGITLFQKRDVT